MSHQVILVAMCLIVITVDIIAYQTAISNIFSQRIHRSSFKYYGGEGLIDIFKSSEGRIPYFIPKSNFSVADTVRFQSDFIRFSGDNIYATVFDARRRSSLLNQLNSATVQWINIAQITPEKIVISWNVSFIPESVTLFNFIGQSYLLSHTFALL